MAKLPKSMITLPTEAALRAWMAEQVKAFAPTWTGESYTTWRAYPVLPNDCPKRATNALALVVYLDSKLTQPALREEFTFWQQILAVVRNSESLIEAGRTLREGRRRGASITNEAHVELHPQYQPEVDRLMKLTGYSYTAVVSQVAAAFRVHESTVKTHTKNPAPRNRGRHNSKAGNR